jgi:hypothetical protein
LFRRETGAEGKLEMTRWMPFAIKTGREKRRSLRLNQPRMAAITKRRVLRMFATAPRESPDFLDFDFLRFKSGAFMRAVAKWLGF